MSWNVKVLLAVVASTALLVVAVWTGIMCLAPHLGQKDYREGQYEGAEKHYSTAMRVTPDAWEGWTAPFNRGTSRLHLGVDETGVGGSPDGDSGAGTYQMIVDGDVIDRGVADLGLALERVPEAERQEGQIVDPDQQPECQVRRNLSIGQELQGDAKVAAGDKESAAAAYQLAQETLGPCQESQQNQEQSERQEQKEQENEQGEGGSENPESGGQSEQDPGGGEQPNEGEGGQNDDDLDPGTQNKQDELNDRNQRGQQEYDEQEGDGDGGGGVNW